MTDVIRLTDTAAFADLGRYAGRARALDAEGAMRLQGTGDVLAAWVGVLAGSGILGEGTVLGLRTFALAEPADVDVVVPLGAVTDRTARAGTDLSVPPNRALAVWAAVTPPRAGWERVGELSGDDLARVGRDGIAEVAAAVQERGAAAGFLKEQVWARPMAVTGPDPDRAGEVRAGGALAAYALGFLGPGAPVAVFRCNRWTRLSGPGGHVLMR
ncbi:MAG: hypothetical protein ABI249_04170 [Ornithinibacter sp.]